MDWVTIHAQLNWAKLDESGSKFLHVKKLNFSNIMKIIIFIRPDIDSPKIFIINETRIAKCGPK